VVQQSRQPVPAARAGRAPGPNEFVDHAPLTDEVSHVAYVNRLHQEWQTLRYPFEPVWFLDISHYLGQQWTMWSRGEGMLRQSNAPSHRIRLTVNRIMPAVKTLMGKLLRGVPRLICSPTDTTDQAKSLARVSDRLLRALWEQLHMFNVQQDAFLWALLTGTSFINVGWDPTLGDHITDDDGRPMYTGDIDAQAVSPFAVYVPRWVRDTARPCELIHSSLEPYEQVRMQFPDAEDLRPDASYGQYSTYEQRVTALTTPIGAMSYVPDSLNDRSVYVKRLWQDPQVLSPWEREQYPTGRLIVTTNTKLLFVGANPYADGKHPLVRFRGGTFPGRFWGIGIENWIPIQRAYNKGRSQMVEARNLVSAPQVRAPKGHGCLKQTNEPGSWLEHVQGLRPEYMTPPEMNQWLVEDLKALLSEFEHVSQVREVSQGGLPAANLTGVGINLLQEADNTPWGPVAAEMALGLAEVGQKMLNRSFQGYIEPRTLTALDELDDDDVLEFFSTGDLAPIKVRCDVTSVMPESRAARLARVESLIKLGALNPQVDKSEILRLMEFGNIESLWMDTEPQVRRAQRENRRLAKGQPQPIATFDEHELHVVEHNKFRSGTEYESFDPMTRMIIDMHVEEHLQAIAELRASMTPPDPGGGQGAAGAGDPNAGGPPPNPSSGLGDF
jgi:hypothetical protein